MHHATVDKDKFFTRSMIGEDPLYDYPPNDIWVEDLPFNNDIMDNYSTNILHDVVPIEDEKRAPMFTNVDVVGVSRIVDL